MNKTTFHTGTKERGSPPRSGALLWGGGIWLAGMPWRTTIPSAPAGASQMPPTLRIPRDSKGAPPNAYHPEAPVWARITWCATAVRRVSETSTTSTRH